MRRLRTMDSTELAFTALRYAIGGVFLWFGMDKFFHPSAWTGWAPGWVLAVVPVESPFMLMLQGALETLIGLALVAGTFVRPAALAATVLLAAISVVIGWNGIAVRDIGLLGGALALLALADASGKRRIGARRLAAFVTAYGILVFIGGVMFLRS